MLSGCTTYGVIKNTPLTPSTASQTYGLRDRSGTNSGDLLVMLAFSGGGTRAAALSYGVLKELRDTTVQIDGRPVRMLDEVDAISSVSGGSFTAAYYGLHGEKTFTDFEGAFLRRNIQSALIDLVLNPFLWFTSTGRTDRAIEFYERNIFHNATFADLVGPKRPFILINASDLAYGVRFSFIQEYFTLLCSDLSTFPIARAVAASSAVPVLFDPVVVENFAGCDADVGKWLEAAKQRAAGEVQTMQILEGAETYLDKDRRKYVHFVDGGITDNLGLRAILEIIDVAGGLDGFFAGLRVAPPRHVVVISVNAATNPEPAMDRSNEQPGIAETISAMNDVQLRRYSAATLDAIKQKMARWAQAVSTPQRPVASHFIQLTFADLSDTSQRKFFEKLPTSFALSDEQVDKLISVGGTLLRENADFRRLLTTLEAR